jgi:hypothetical protein
MWSLTSPRAKRISDPKKFRSSAKEDFFNTIGTSRTRRDVGVGSAMRRWSQPVDATLYLKEEMECIGTIILRESHWQSRVLRNDLH